MASLQLSLSLSPHLSHLQSFLSCGSASSASLSSSNFHVLPPLKIKLWRPCPGLLHGRRGACFGNVLASIPNPADVDPVEVGDDDDDDGKASFLRDGGSGGGPRYRKIARESERLREEQMEEYSRNRAVFREAIGLDPNGPDEEDDRVLTGGEEEDTGREGPEIVRIQGPQDAASASELSEGGFFDDVDKAVAFVKSKQLNSPSSNLPPLPPPMKDSVQNNAEIEGGVEVEEDGIEEDGVGEDILEELEDEDDVPIDYDDILADPSFDLDFAELEEDPDIIKEPTFQMTLSELLDDARVVPISVEGDLDIEISGVQHDSRQVSRGDLFVCCPGFTTDGHFHLSEAVERGASAIVASKEISVQVNVKAVVMVEDTNSIISALASAFYRNPSQKLAMVAITGTNGKTTTSYLLKSMYEAMGLKTGLLGTIAYYINGNKKLDAPNTTPDAIYLQKLMATMLHNGTEVCVLEVSSHALALDRCKEVDFDVAVFTNLTRDHLDFHKTEEEYRRAKGKLFEKMVDPARQRKVINIDDPNASYFIALGSRDVPVVTFSMVNRDADVYALDVQLSLFETEVLVRTPRGNLEISSGLLGRHNVYNILTAVAVGIAIDAPLEDIVRGIEEVDAVPGRCELIDEEQAFAVIVDYAHTPDALSRLLDTVRECGARRIITVIGCGGDRDRGKRPIMAKIATDKSEVTIFTSDNPRSEDPLYILDDMLAGIGWTMDEYLRYGLDDYYPPLRNGHRVFVHDVRTIAVRAAVAMGEEGDAVVIAGKGHETYQITGDQVDYFDDKEECREALQHVDALHAAGVDTSEFPWRVPESH